MFSAKQHHLIYEFIKSGELEIIRWGPYASPPLHRFWSKVNKDGPVHPIHGQCWEWTTGKDLDGYGVFRVPGVCSGAHRYSYSIHCGPIPDGLLVCHHCDNPACVRPEHLFTGTHQDNQADKVAKGRQSRVGGATGERNGQHTHPERTARGEAINTAKLSEADVREIRRRYVKWSTVNGSGAMAREFGVGSSTVSDIVRRVTWAHLS